MSDLWFHRWPADVISGLFALLLLLALFASRAVGRRRGEKEQPGGLGSLETMASGLLGLLLAFNFSFAQSRFDERERMIVREADAIGTTYLRCSVLETEDRRVCRDQVRKYAESRVAAYASYGRSDKRSLAAALDRGEELQKQLWSRAIRAAHDHPDPPRALLVMTLNDLIDLDSDRRASIRIVVPPAVSITIMLACLGWAVLFGYTAGVQNRSSWTGWVVVALLIAAVFGVALDLDRPATGLVTTAAADRSIADVLHMMERSTPD